MNQDARTTPRRLADEIEAVADAIYNQNAIRSRQLSDIAAAVARLELALSETKRSLPNVLREASAFLAERGKPTLAGDCATCATVIEEILTDDAKGR